MFLWAIESLNGLIVDNLLIVVLAEHRTDYKLDKLLEDNCKFPYTIVAIDDITEGQLCTVLSAENYMKFDRDILIISSDTLVISDIKDVIMDRNSSSNGIISTMVSNIGDNWSFVRIDDNNNVIEVAEKNRISDYISTGLYYFKSTLEFLKYAHQLIQLNIRVNGEFYIIPVYDLMLKDKLNFKIANSIQMWDMGNPEAKEAFEIALNNNLVLINE
jgi:dTDP-glucose pyrophosphorylase